MTTHHPVAIIGGGLGGLMAARVLHVHGVQAALFELESDRHARVQGGMLDIHDDNGQQAVRAAGLWDEFVALIHPGGETSRIVDHTATVLREDADDGTLSRPEVDRGQLRDMLIDSLPTGTIRWGHKIDEVLPVHGHPGRHEVRFVDREPITTDLLVGADGAWSKVRPLVSSAWPAYTGLSFVEGDLYDGAVRHPEQAAVMGQGMLFAFRGPVGILGHLETDGSLHFYLGFRVDPSWLDTLDVTDTAATKTELLGRLEGWDDALRGLVADVDSDLVARRIHALPVGHRWDRVPGVTLLGDAAHLMSPFAGEGANLAMQDGALLAQAIAEHRDDGGMGDIEKALEVYEADLFPRATEAAAASAQSLDILFSDDSPRGLLEMFAGFDAQAAGQADAGAAALEAAQGTTPRAAP